MKGDLRLHICSVGLEQSVRNDVALMKKWPFLPEGIPVVGYTVDIQTGALTKIV